MKYLVRSFAAFAAVCFMAATAFAADPSGTWKWTQQGRGGGGQPREMTLKLAMKDGKLSGELSSPGRDGGTNTTPISNASVKGDTIAFSIEREFNGNKFVTKYSGKLSGDSITGESESPGRNGGDPTKREWVAKRAN